MMVVCIFRNSALIKIRIQHHAATSLCKQLLKPVKVMDIYMDITYSKLHRIEEPDGL